MISTRCYYLVSATTCKNDLGRNKELKGILIYFNGKNWIPKNKKNEMKNEKLTKNKFKLHLEIGTK